MSEDVRLRFVVRGVVQGVGFRPFVYRIANELDLSGSIGNDTDGVTIEVQGIAENTGAFVRRLRDEKPPLSRIDAIEVYELESIVEFGFHIVASESHGSVSTGIPADAATCADCLRELLDPADRRYRYPFANCTNCGPRYTITRRIPYDRPQTSMTQFRMCAECQREYDDPLNRRFHAQPNACWMCGPQVWLEDRKGNRISSGDPVTEIIRQLAVGRIAAIKGIGGFHLSVDASNESAIQTLRQRKHRFGKPLAVMVKDIDAARRFAFISLEEEHLLTSSASPIVLARQREDGGLAESVAPGVPWLGLFLPYSPLQHLLFASGDLQALVMTSANLSEEPIAIDNREAIARLGDIADIFLMHDREILQRCDDSVTAVIDEVPKLIRRARGFVPLSVPLPIHAAPLLAAGGHLKNTLAIARGRHVYQSQHIGDLETVVGLEFFKESLNHLMRTFELEPTAVAHDLHPGYLSTQFAKEWAADRNLPLIDIQHHHAHIAACMGENEMTERVIGIALDGTGYGTDGRIWGGEVLLCSLNEFERKAHLEYIPMPGGEAAVHEPWRMAFGALHAAGLAPEHEELRSLLGVEEKELKIMRRMIEREINSPLTSSCGRLFDAAAALILGRRTVDYEAQAAIELEGVAIDEPYDVAGYRLEIERAAAGDDARSGSDNPMMLRTRSMWEELIHDLKSGIARSRIAARFHTGVSDGFVQAALHARAATGVNRVALSGGCMHNRRMAKLLREKLQAEDFAVLRHRQVSPGDAGLSYGQAVCAAAILARHAH